MLLSPYLALRSLQELVACRAGGELLFFVEEVFTDPAPRMVPTLRLAGAYSTPDFTVRMLFEEFRPLCVSDF